MMNESAEVKEARQEASRLAHQKLAEKKKLEHDRKIAEYEKEKEAKMLAAAQSRKK